MKTLGLAMGGGGARGLAHIGVLQVLEREAIPIHLITGTSMGGLIAAAYACGMTPAEMDAEAVRMSRPRNLLTMLDRGLPRRGLMTGTQLAAYIRSLLGDRYIQDLDIPLGLVAVDLNSSEKAIIRQGSVVEAVRATTAVPGLFEPVETGDQLLVDGGLYDNMPADAAREMGADMVIGVDVTTDYIIRSMTLEFARSPLVPAVLAEFFDLLARSLDALIREANRNSLEQGQPDLVLRPVIPDGVTILSGFGHAKAIIAAGERAAETELNLIRSLVTP